MLNAQIPDSHLKIYLFVLFGMCAVILSALAFEHIGGYQPCKLCLEQRQPWYFGIPLMMVASLSVFQKWPPVLSRILLLAVGLVLVVSVFLGVRHAGVEWDWWEGPGGCGIVEGGLATSTADLLNQLNQTVPPSCDESALRVLGLSFAGWNALVSVILAAVALRTVFKS